MFTVGSGWELGISPKRRVAGRLFDHHPPAHLSGQRYLDWLTGYDEGKRYSEIYMAKSVHFVGTDRDGKEVLVKLKGWGCARGEVLSRMEKKGCGGDVLVFYFEGSTLKRTLNCGI